MSLLLAPPVFFLLLLSLLLYSPSPTFPPYCTLREPAFPSSSGVYKVEGYNNIARRSRVVSRHYGFLLRRTIPSSCTFHNLLQRALRRSPSSNHVDVMTYKGGSGQWLLEGVNEVEPVCVSVSKNKKGGMTEGKDDKGPPRLKRR